LALPRQRKSRSDYRLGTVELDCAGPSVQIEVEEEQVTGFGFYFPECWPPSRASRLHLYGSPAYRSVYYLATPTLEGQAEHLDCYRLAMVSHQVAIEGEAEIGV
jgi:hypothetical protein